MDRHPSPKESTEQNIKSESQDFPVSQGHPLNVHLDLRAKDKKTSSLWRDPLPLPASELSQDSSTSTLHTEGSVSRGIVSRGIVSRSFVDTLDTVLMVVGDYRAIVTSFGARLISLSGPDRTDIVVGPRDIFSILEDQGAMGATVGRVANRIAHGKLTIPSQGTYQLPLNDGRHHLHGGPKGFDKRLWQLTAWESHDKEAYVTFELDSHDGDQGYPGSIHVKIVYQLTNMGELSIKMLSTAHTHSTPINLTNHTYWNLSSENYSQTCLDHTFQTPFDAVLETDSHLIPTGNLKKTRGTAYDFTVSKALGRDFPRFHDPLKMDGYDVFFTSYPISLQKINHLSCIALLKNPEGDRTLEVWSNQPGFQLYTGNYLKAPYFQNQGVCIEPSGYIDAVNHEHFPSVMTPPGQTICQTVLFKLRHHESPT
jgi:aldose 1-epimerase